MSGIVKFKSQLNITQSKNLQRTVKSIHNNQFQHYHPRISQTTSRKRPRAKKQNQ